MGIRSESAATRPVKVMASVIALPIVKSLAMVVVPVVAPMLSVVAAPPMFKVVAVALTRLKVVAVVVRSPPLTAKSPEITVLALLMVVVPVLAPMLSVVAAPPRLRVVTVDWRRLNDVAEEVMSPPLTPKSPVTVAELLIVVVPVEAPREIVVAAPPIFRVVAVALIRLKVVSSVSKSPSLICRSSATTRVAPPRSEIVPSTAKLPLLSRLATVVPEAEAVQMA